MVSAGLPSRSPSSGGVSWRSRPRGATLVTVHVAHRRLFVAALALGSALHAAASSSGGGGDAYGPTSSGGPLEHLESHGRQLHRQSPALSKAPPRWPAPELRILLDGNVRGVLVPPLGVGTQSHAAKKEARRQDPDLLLLATGNMLGPSRTSHADGGAAALAMLNRAGFDAVALGRLDLFAGLDTLLDRVQEARFPVLATNLTLHEDARGFTDRWARLRRHKLVERGGQRTLVLAAISEEARQRAGEWDPAVVVEAPIEALTRAREAAPEHDYVVVLADLPIEEIMLLMKGAPWIDLVLVSQGLGENDAVSTALDLGFPDGRRVVWAPYFGEHLVRVTAHSLPDPALGGVPRLRTRAEVVTLEEPDPEAPSPLRTVDALRTAAQAEAGSPLLAELTRAEREDPWALVADALRAELDTEVTLLTRGSLRDPHPPKRLTALGLRGLYPFTDRGARVTLEGFELRDLWARRNEFFEDHDDLLFQGIYEKRGIVLVNGRVLDNRARYRVAVTERMARGARSLGLADKMRRSKDTVYDLVRRFLQRPGDRARRRRRLGREAIFTRRLQVDITRNESELSGSTPAFQFRLPNTSNRGSDIPGLVGRDFITQSLQIEARAQIDMPRFDWRLRLEAALSRFNATTTQDRALFELRYERKDPGSKRGEFFGEVEATTTMRDLSEFGRDRPLFLKTQFGKLWRPNQTLRLNAGVGRIARLSQPGDPGSTGLNLGYDFRRKLVRDIEISSNLDFFLGADSAKVRTLDWRYQLRVPIGKYFSTVLRQRLFLFEDDTVSEPATRTETFLGLGVNLERRRH